MTDLLADPEIDPTATYAVDPALARSLTAGAVHGARPQTLTTTSPMTGAPLAVLPLSTPDDVSVAMSNARRGQRGWAATSFEDRAAIMLRFHDLVLERQVELLDVIQLESGKARKHAFEEIADVAIIARHYGRRAEDYLRPRRRGPGAIPLLSQAVESHHPRGVVGIISPWNYPLSLSITDAIPALMAGNAVVLRPDLQATLCALSGVALLREAGLPDDVLQVVVGDGASVGQAVVDRADYISFTGSTATGRTVAATAAQRLVGASLELGGKNGLYVADDANLTRAVEGAVRGSFASAGQLCVSPERIVLHEDIADRFVPEFVSAVAGLKLGTDLSYGIDMGSLVSAEQLETVTAHVDDARAKGATVLTGGRARPDIGPYYYEPTVLSGVTSAMRCRDEETFGPVVAIYRVGCDDDAVRLINDTEFGLNAAIFTGSVSRGRALAAQLRVGTVNINEVYAAAWASVGAPMGGMKDSGLGRRHGREGILKYTESQNVTAQHVWGFGPPPGMTDEAFARALTVSLSVMKKLGLR